MTSNQILGFLMILVPITAILMWLDRTNRVTSFFWALGYGLVVGGAMAIIFVYGYVVMMLLS